MSFKTHDSGYVSATCDACWDECTDGMAYEDVGACQDEVHANGGYANVADFMAPGTELVLCARCLRAYTHELAEVEELRFMDGDALALWAAKGWARRRLAILLEAAKIATARSMEKLRAWVDA
jgi:hypothetical protein